MVILDVDTASECSDYSYYSGYDSDADSCFCNGHVHRSKRSINNYVSLDQLKDEYDENMDMDKKILLFFKAGEDEDLTFMDRLLLDGVAVDCTGRDGWTVLMKACLDGRKNVVEYLLQHNCNVNFNADLFTPLMACCTNSFATEDMKLACVELLLRHNVDINRYDKYRTTAFMRAASSGYLNIVSRLLLEEELNPHERDCDGWNAVFYAVSNNHIQVVKKLIENGLNYKSGDGCGRTPVNLAEERCYRKLADMIKQNDWDSEELAEPDGEEFSQTSKYLMELPNEDGEGGFESDTEEVLGAFGYSCGKNISFSDFLSMGARDLVKAGIKIAKNRQMILEKGIHRYHLFPWHTDSMLSIESTPEWEVDDLIAVVASSAKHLTLIKASLRYLAKRIQARQSKGDKSIHKEIIDTLVSCYATNEQLRERLQKLDELKSKIMFHKMDDDIAFDSVRKLKSTKSKMRPMLKYGLIILGATTAGYLMFRLRMNVGC